MQSYCCLIHVIHITPRLYQHDPQIISTWLACCVDMTRMLQQHYSQAVSTWPADYIDMTKTVSTWLTGCNGMTIRLLLTWLSRYICMAMMPSVAGCWLGLSRQDHQGLQWRRLDGDLPARVQECHPRVHWGRDQDGEGAWREPWHRYGTPFLLPRPEPWHRYGTSFLLLRRKCCIIMPQLTFVCTKESRCLLHNVRCTSLAYCGYMVCV